MEIERLPFGQSLADKHRAAELKWRGKPPGIPPEMAIEFMEKLEAGSTIRKLTGGGVVGPAMVSRERFLKHCELNPGWGAEVRRISDINVRLLKGSRERAKTHCKYGHPLFGVTLYVRKNGKRQCLLCAKRRDSAPPPPSAEQLRQVTAALNAGKPLRLICSGMVGPNRSERPIVSHIKLIAYRRQNPEFESFVRSAVVANNSRGQIRRRNSQHARTDEIRAENNDYSKIRYLIPSHLPSDVRDDIAHEVFLSLFEGRLRRDQVRGRVQQFVRDHNQMFPTKFAKFGDSPLLSLDEVLFDDRSATRGDNVSRGLWD